MPFFVHENWRWQAPMRALAGLLRRDRIGAPFRARLQFSHSFPVFDNQPFLRDVERFIISDMGSHTLDVARFLFGEVSSLYCQTGRVHPDIRGEDVATIVSRHGDERSSHRGDSQGSRRGDSQGSHRGDSQGSHRGDSQGSHRGDSQISHRRVTVTQELAYAGLRESERYPQTSIFVEGERGSLEMLPGYARARTTQPMARWWPPPSHPSIAWVHPTYAVVQSSIVSCNSNLLAALVPAWTAPTEKVLIACAAWAAPTEKVLSACAAWARRRRRAKIT